MGMLVSINSQCIVLGAVEPSQPTITYPRSVGDVPGPANYATYNNKWNIATDGDEINFQWKASNASSYNYKFKRLTSNPDAYNDNEGDPAPLKQGSTKNPYIGLSVDYGTWYKLAVQAVSSSGNASDYRVMYVGVTPDSARITSPKNIITKAKNGVALKYVEVSAGEPVTIAWNSSTSNAESYLKLIELSGNDPNPASESEPASKTFVNVQQMPGNKYTLSNMTPGKWYKVQIQVKSTRYTGTYALSRWMDDPLYIYAKESAKKAPSATMNITKPSESATVNPENVGINWSSVSGASKYKLSIYDIDTGKYFEDYKNLNVGNTTSHWVPNDKFALTPGHNYKITVAAFDSSGNEMCSDEVKIKASEKPVIKYPEEGGEYDCKNVFFQWEPVSQATEYVLLVKNKTKGTEQKYYPGNRTIESITLEENSKYTVGMYALVNGSDIWAEKSINFTTLSSETEVTSIELGNNTLTLNEGEQIELLYDVYPENATDKDVKWTSSSSNVAAVSNGVIIARSEGTATITAQSMSNSNIKATCYVTVLPLDKKTEYYDVPDYHKNYEAIMELTDRGVINGKKAGYFCPEDSITRAEFVKMMCIAFDLKNRGNKKIFDDTQNHWAKEYISIAESNGLVNGVDEYNFNPNGNIPSYSHVGIYIGNGESIEGSSSDKVCNHNPYNYNDSRTRRFLRPKYY